MKDLEKCRQEIDEIDEEIMALFVKRMHVVKDVVKYKLANDLEVFQVDREQIVIDKNKQRVKDKELVGYAGNFMQELMNISKSYQFTFLPLDNNYVLHKPKNNNLTVGYQGVKGAFSHLALEEYFKNAKAINYHNFEDVFIALKNNQIDYGIVPLENSSSGAINDNYDLVRDYDCYIVGEHSISISQHLLGIKGTKIEDIKEVYSHIQGFVQSSKFLNKYPNIIQTSYTNTAAAAKYVSQLHDKSNAAIASMMAAKLYDLEVIAKNIHNEKSNHTRFIVIGKNLEDHQDASCVSIVFTLKHQVGSLYNILKTIKDYQINLSRIESRPIKDKNWEYYFYLDFEGSLHDETIHLAIAKMKTYCKMLKIIGNYKQIQE